MNTELRQKTRNDFEKRFSSWWIQFSVKTWTHRTCNGRKQKKLFGVRTKLSYNYIFLRKFISHRDEKKQTLMNKPVYLGLSILELSKIVMYEFWNDYVKPKYQKKSKTLLYTDIFIVYLNGDDIYQGIAEAVETRYDRSFKCFRLNGCGLNAIIFSNFFFHYILPSYCFLCFMK